MKTIKKSENPNIWWLIQWTRNGIYDNIDICKLRMHMLAGIMVAIVMVGIGVLIGILVTAAPLFVLTGIELGVGSGFVVLSFGFYLFVTVTLIGNGLKYLHTLLYNKMKNHLKIGPSWQQSKEPKEPSALKLMYTSWKEKYCVQVKIEDDI